MVVQNSDLPVKDKESLRDFVIRVLELSEKDVDRVTYVIYSREREAKDLGLKLIQTWKSQADPSSSMYDLYEAARCAKMSTDDIQCFIDAMADLFEISGRINFPPLYLL